jgi:hypothetical protein
MKTSYYVAVNVFTRSNLPLGSTYIQAHLHILSFIHTRSLSNTCIQAFQPLGNTSIQVRRSRKTMASYLAIQRYVDFQTFGKIQVSNHI